MEPHLYLGTHVLPGTNLEKASSKSPLADGQKIIKMTRNFPGKAGKDTGDQVFHPAMQRLGAITFQTGDEPATGWALSLLAGQAKGHTSTLGACKIPPGSTFKEKSKRHGCTWMYL